MIDSILLFDRALFQWLNGFHHPIADIFFLAVTQLGNGWVVAPLLIGIVVLRVPRRQIGKVLLCGIIGMSMCGIINSQIKKKVRRLRPVAYWQQKCTTGGDVETLQHGNNFSVHQVGTNYSSRSFPSGHTNTAFTAATLLFVLFGFRFATAYSAAVLVGYSRIYLGVHFPLDVVAGALSGCLLMALFLKLCRCDRRYITAGTESL